MIPAPQLDDRTYADIVAEAMRLIPRYCPEWTNHNPSDPGITVLELTAWMTELILYRLNRVPEKTYLAFLNMIGIRLRSPQPAHALITFDLVEGAEKQVIKEGTQIATAQAADEDTIIFETQKELIVVGAPLDRCFSYFNETYADNSPFLRGSREEGFEVFAGADRVDRFLYVGDPRLKAVPDMAFANLDGGVFLALDLGKNVFPLGQQPKIDQCLYFCSREMLSQPEAEVRLEVVLSDATVAPAPTPSEDLVLSWEYFDGKKWRILGKSGPKGTIRGPENPWAFIDTTNGFSHTGLVTFRVPNDMHAGE